MAITHFSSSDDPRKRALRFGLGQLSVRELARLRQALQAPGGVLLDHGNYDAVRGIWCPLAVALGFPECWSGPTIRSDQEAKRAILEVGCARHGSFSLNPIKGTMGTFFTTDRRRDVLGLVDAMLADAGSESLAARRSLP